MRRDAARWASEDVVELCAFRAGDDEYVVDLRRIREVIAPLEVRPVPRSPESIEGVIDLRGEIVPVVDVRRRLGIPPAALSRKGKFLIAQVGSRRVALIVDGVSEVIRVGRSAIRGAPPAATGHAARLFLGVCSDRPFEPGPRGAGQAGAPRERLRLLLNVRALLEPLGPEEVRVARKLAEGGERGGTPV